METIRCYDAGTVDPKSPKAAEETAREVELWVARAQAGDAEAFEALYRRHAGRIYALCLRMAGDPREAEELVQDAFVRAWEKLDSFRGKSAFSSWLHRLTVNVVLGRWRSRGRRRERVVAFEDLAGSRTLEDAPAATVRPGQPGAGVDLERAIAVLPDGARTVFVLYDIEGYTHPEIAEMTGLAVGTCKAQLHRARALLRKALRR